jgi:hypothetical protein
LAALTCGEIRSHSQNAEGNRRLRNHPERVIDSTLAVSPTPSAVVAELLF